LTTLAIDRARPVTYAAIRSQTKRVNGRARGHSKLACTVPQVECNVTAVRFNWSSVAFSRAISI
jgi:hypothetical protein